MIIYGDNKEVINFNAGLSRIESLINSLEYDGFSDHNHAAELLISTGEFESALVDYLCPENDLMDDLASLLRRLSVAAGHILINTLDNNAAEVKRWSISIRENLSALKYYNVSSLLTYNIPEGYAFYSLYPEMYINSADNFFHEFHPSEATVIGIRSIGTSLSAVVAARLEESGCRVLSVTLRPRGFYFDRTIVTGIDLEEELKSFHHGFYLIVDEGPGLSGSSFTSAAEKLTSLGISAERIIFFPGYRTDGSNFVSEKSREIWKRHRQFTSEFENVISVKNLFPEFTGQQELKDISAGMWRPAVFNSAEEYPPVYSNFEQRKYLTADIKYFIKFAGLGRYGKDLFQRARELSTEGFSPEVQGFNNGFILSKFADGRPLTSADVNRDLLERVSRYIAFLRRSFPAQCSRLYNEAEEMISVNLMKGLGDAWAEKFNKLSPGFKPLYSSYAAAVDGRMLPWEWIHSSSSYIKTDSIHHHKDHFFPGCQDAAWDIAGFCTEFSLGKEDEQFLISSYSKQSGDNEIKSRLPFYYIFYNAFRLGMTLFSAQMSMEPEKQKFNLLSSKYSGNLKNLLMM
ncbi:MAG: hypothetical protein ACM3QX_10505 [Syntrophomonadaceae bacterium]